MRWADKVELGAIVAASALTLWLAPMLPNRLSIGSLMLVGASIFLGQGVLRDVWLLLRSKRNAAGESGPARQCLCVESGLGVLVIVLGLTLLLAGVSTGVALSRASWTVLVAGALLVGFFLKDYVFEWNPWRLRREPDHLNVVLRGGGADAPCARQRYGFLVGVCAGPGRTDAGAETGGGGGWAARSTIHQTRRPPQPAAAAPTGRARASRSAQLAARYSRRGPPRTIRRSVCRFSRPPRNPAPSGRPCYGSSTSASPCCT